MRVGTTIGKWLEMPIGGTRFAWRKFWLDSTIAYLFLLPTILVITLFSFYPVLRALYISFFDLNFLNMSAKEFIGFANYKEVLTDPDFWMAVKNTIIFVLGTVPVQTALALGIALLLNQKLRGVKMYRFAFFVPHITLVTAISMVWLWIYHEQYGLLNYLLSLFGAHPQRWLLDPKWTMFTIILMSIWKTLGYTAVLFLAGLQNVDKELYNAAKVDGANNRQMFRHVTWPMLTPTTFFVTITSLIGSFKVFNEIFVLYGGQPGPVRAGLTMVFYIYEKAWTDYRAGFASAAAYLLFLMVLGVTLVQLWYSKRRVYYD
jgi:multiple sugar transport system permease protein